MKRDKVDILVPHPPSHHILFDSTVDEARVQYYRGEKETCFCLIRDRAAAGGSSAEAVLASMYLNNWVDRPDYLDVAIQWAELSAAKNNPYGYWILAWAKLESEFWADGIDAMLNAAELEFSPALFDLGVLNLHGDIVPKNVDNGVQLLRIAANAGHVHAIRSIESIRMHGGFGFWQKIGQLLANPIVRPGRFIHAIFSATSHGPERLFYFRALHVRNNFKRKVEGHSIDPRLEQEFMQRFDRIRRCG